MRKVKGYRVCWNSGRSRDRRLWATLEAACLWANTIARVYGIFVCVEEVYR